jgi:hypothetical protein
LGIPRSRRRGGFALLITITLLAFLVLLLVSLASLTRVETQVGANNQQLAQARQNALMALNIALGQLQKHTGPDQRVTATADLQPVATSAAPSPYPTTDPASGVNLGGATTTVLNSIDQFWRGSRNRRWTGAWKNTNTSAYDADIPAAFNPVPGLQTWLVSGNETIPNNYRPTDVVTGLTAASTPLDDIKDALNRSHRLLVKVSAGVTDAASLDRAITAPQVPISSTGVPGTNGAPTPVGNYAWWIGDEGVKARANLVDPYAATSTAVANRVRLQSAQRPAIEAMTTDGIDGLATTYPANDADLLKVFALDQLNYLSAAATFPDELKDRFHALSFSSRGVLADTRHGGLKHDLSYLLTRPDSAALHTAFASTLPGFAPNTTAPNDYNRLLSTSATPYATQPPLLLRSNGAFAYKSIYSGMDMFSYSATWEQLWSYHNLGNGTSGTPAGVFTGSGDDVRPRLHTAKQHGIAPLLIQVKLFYKLRLSGTAPPVLDAGVDRTSDIWMDIIPVVVLANPYNVPLEAQDYILRSAALNGRIRLYHGLTSAQVADEGTLTLSPSSPSVNERAMSNNGLGSIKITLKAPRMEAGRAYVFTLENSLTTIPNTAAGQLALSVAMINDFNPTNALTYNTLRKIAPSPATHAALTTDEGIIGFRLHSADYTAALGDQTLIRCALPHSYAADKVKNTILVYPLSQGLRHGGGMNMFIHDASNVAKSQQTTFSQVNYRGLIVANANGTEILSDNTGNPNGTDQTGTTLSWARTRVKSGAASLPGNDTPSDFIQSHLLWRDPANPTEVRWGIYNTGEAYDGTVVPSSLSGDTGLVNILYDVPRAVHPPSSLAQLRHFNIAGHISRTDWQDPHLRDEFATANHSFQPNHPIGNSYPNPFIIRQKVIDGDLGMGFQYDGSYLLNDALQDRFFFSTFPAAGAFDFATGKLINNRNQPFRPQTSVAWDNPANFRTDSLSAAKNLLVDGAFNINSTSVDAWKALLSGLKDVPVGGETASANLSAPFARTLFQTGSAANSRDGNTVNAWTGTINLTPAEIDSLAREIVLQIRRRGPFLSLADFTNRRLIAAASDTVFGLGLSGALQSAIDRIFNQTTDVQPASLRTKSNSRSGNPSATPVIDPNKRLAEDAFIMPTGISGFSGYILQSDLLSALGPVLSARSDTFTIRTYGDTVNPATGAVQARAWCEAVVQRTPDYVVPKAGAVGNAPDEAATDPTNLEFGRRYQVVSFRWLSPEDI